MSKKTIAESKKPGFASKAFLFALNAHDSAKYADRPFSVHLAAVQREAALLAGLGVLVSLDETFVAALYLHDTVEVDQKNYFPIKVQFGETVAELVWAVSGFGRNRVERNADIAAKIKAKPVAAIIKVCDRLANIKDAIATGNKNALAMYLEEHPSFLNTLETLSWSDIQGSLTSEVTQNVNAIKQVTKNGIINAYSSFVTPLYEARLKRKAREDKKKRAVAK